MSSRALALVRALAPLSLGLALVGCSLSYCGDDAFGRGVAIRRGEIAGTALLPGPEPKAAAFVQASMTGTPFVRRTNSEGRFVFSGLAEGAWIVTLTEDGDGDGRPERRRVVTAVLREVPHKTSPEYVPLLAGERPAELAGVDVGEVVLEGIARVSGTVLLDGAGGPLPPSARGRVGVVVAGRHLDLPRLASDDTDLVALGAEAKAGVDDEGRFLLRNVSGGDAYLLVLVYEPGAAPGQLGALVQVSEPIPVSASGDELVLAADVIVAPDVAAQRRPGQLLFSPPPAAGDDVYLVFVPPGLEMPPCEDAPLDYTSHLVFPYALTTAQIPASGLPQFSDLPVGVWDVQACFSSAPPGTLFAQPVPPVVDDEAPLLLGPVLLTDLQACVPSRPCDAETPCGDNATCDVSAGRCVYPSGWTDCDGDERRGLPRIADDDERDLWLSCASQCFPAVGEPTLDATCEASDGAVYDCDDDGDGQPDVTESQACYGVGKGTDGDGDGICDGTDPFPTCRANTAEACDADAEPDPPALAAELDDAPAMCGVARDLDATGQYCAGAAVGETLEQCQVLSVSCTLTVTRPAVVPRCEVETGLGCGDDPELYCAVERAGPDGVAPCAHQTDFGCTVAGDTAPCAEGFVCLEVDSVDGPVLRCGSDFDSALYTPVDGTRDCTCFCGVDQPCGSSEVAVSAAVADACTGAELQDVWRVCHEETAPGGDAGPGGRCVDDGFCDETCPDDPDCLQP